MTIYSVKINNRLIVKTSSLHEARGFAKQVLADKVASEKNFIEKCNRDDTIPFHPYLNSVSEKMYIRGSEVEYCFYATVVVARGQRKTYRSTIKAENVPSGGYDFDLHSEIANKVDQKEQINKEKYAE